MVASAGAASSRRLLSGNSMRFRTIFPAGTISKNVLVYREDEHSFDIVPRPDNFTSLLINDLNLELNEQGRVTSVWGLCPYTTWESAKLNPPAAKFGNVLYVTESPLAPGVSIRLSRDRWPVFVDASSGWVHVDGGSQAGSAIEILAGVVLEIDGPNGLYGIWLKPEKLPKLI
jgi:hypothetical protein